MKLVKSGVAYGSKFEAWVQEQAPFVSVIRLEQEDGPKAFMNTFPTMESAIAHIEDAYKSIGGK